MGLGWINTCPLAKGQILRMARLEEIQLVPRRRNPYPPPSESDVSRYEAAFGVTLPPRYVAFLRHCNGGSSRAMKLRFSVGPLTYDVNDFYGLGPPTDQGKDWSKGWDYGNLWDETRVGRPHVGDRGVPIGRDGGGGQFFLDYSTVPPSVAWIIGPGNPSTRLAENFEAFLELILAGMVPRKPKT